MLLSVYLTITVCLLVYSEKLDDLEQLFLNMHNLINAFRPHQVRFDLPTLELRVCHVVLKRGVCLQK